MTPPVTRREPLRAEEQPMTATDSSDAWPGAHDYTARVALAEHIASGLHDELHDDLPQDA